MNHYHYFPPNPAHMAEFESLRLLITKQGKTIMAALDDLTREVSENKSVTESAAALLRGLKAKLDAAIASGDPKKLKELSDSLDKSGNDLAEAVAANTPAEEEPETPAPAPAPAPPPPPVVVDPIP